jgi:aminopeptidase-like protein
MNKKYLDFSPQMDLDFTFDLLKKIWQYDRLQSFDAFEKCAKLIAKTMKAIGCVDVEIQEFKADGHHFVQDWIVPKAWDIKSGSLMLLDKKAKKKELANYKKWPTSIFMYSAATPKAGHKVKMCYVKLEEKNNLPNVDGKIVFLDYPEMGLINRLRDGGALGIVSDFPLALSM